MSQQIINISTPDDGLGDVLRNGFDKTNQNFTELYNGKVDKVAGKGLSENDFTDADKTKLDGIEAGAQVNVQADWGETDTDSDSFILNKPPSLYSAFGYFHVSDLATQTTPLSFVASTPLQLTNDNAGVFTSESNAPYGVPKIWNTSTNSLDFTHLSVGDAVLVRTDLLISTTAVNQTLQIYIKFGIGTASEYDLLIDSWNEKSVVSFKHFNKDVSFSIDNDDWKDAPAKIYLLSDNSGSIKVNGWYTPIIRKSINLIEIEGGGGTWGTITGTLSDQIDLQSALNGKQPALVSGTNIKTINSNSILGSGDLVIESNVHRNNFYVMASMEQSGLLFDGITAINRFQESGTRSFINPTGTSRLLSLYFQNYLSATTTGANCGIRQINNADGIYRQGFDNYFVFGNNDANSSCQTMVGHYGAVTATPIGNVAISALTTDFIGCGNDVVDTNLSFYAHRVSASGQTANYVKVSCGASFPAHDTSSAYLLRMEAPQTETDANRYVKMTITNLITGATFTHTFPYTETPVLDRQYATTVVRSNRNTGVATNIKFGKIQVIRKMF